MTRAKQHRDPYRDVMINKS